MIFFAIIIGLVAGLIFYSSNMASYKKAGAGQIYSISASTDANITRRQDLRMGTRSHVDRGFYSSSVSSSGRSEAYHMPQSIKQSIQQAQSGANRPNANPANRPVSRPPRPSMDNRPAGHRGQGGPRGSGRR